MSIKPTKRSIVLANALERSVNKLKTQKRAGQPRATLVAPVLPDWWPGEPEFAGLVPADKQEEDMDISIGIWPNPAQDDQTDFLQFEWKLQNSSDWQPAQAAIELPGPLDPDSFPIVLKLAKENFKIQGTYDLRYTVTGENGVLTPSDLTQIIIDKTPPANNQSPAKLTFVDQTVTDEGITGEYLNTNGGVVVVIPGYQDEQPGDNVDLYVYMPATSPTEPTYRAPMDQNRQIKIPADRFDGLLDGFIYVSYRLLDKVGNHGPRADDTITGLFRNPLPEAPLPLPTVPRISDDKILNLADIASGTETLVEIEHIPNALEGDVVEATWGTAAIKIFHDITQPAAKIVLSVPYDSILEPAYGGATTVLPTSVKYVVKRGNRTFDSPEAIIDVDFFVPGPVNPDRPNPENPNLPKVTVRGTGASPEDNVLNEDDAGKPVEVTVALYQPIGPQERMVLYWYSLDNPVAEFAPVVDATNPYTFTVEWDAIKDLPSGTNVPVFYTVGRMNDTGNIELCVPTLVDVSAALPIKLADPEFPDAGSAAGGVPILNCNSFIGPDQNVAVEIPSNTPRLKGGEKLTFTWQCYTDKVGNVPVGTALVTERDITEAEAINGFSLVFGPFETHIKPVGTNGSIKLTYESDTQPPMKGEMLIRASATNSAGFCPPNPRRRATSKGCGC
ncbi:hypothetical protein IFT47_02860 [Pseudomonas sp. CFBP 13711]|uniref:hypothetical protein n=1 Tax=unclassified Pseudomonas TaxID=196821 RepID=UPI00177F2020|nr:MULTISPECIES: hypothetical protein [unclassified Pseudomonas]MBD8705572.1 hypothetical protein [Pseudomonas sp. CFBP 13711]MBD8710729.1 hypothetical protein [Pseudomonas sp. CFBP 13715]